MKIIFFGGKPLGYKCFNYLVSETNHNIQLLVPNFEETSEKFEYYKKLMLKKCKLNEKGLEIEVVLSKDLRTDKEVLRKIGTLNPDIIFAIFFTQIIPKEILDIPRFGCINIHFAPLPRYRGYYPTTFAIINGEKQHGVTMHYISEGLDEGDIIIQKMLDIVPNERGESLYFKCVELGFQIFKDGLKLFKSGNIKGKKQEGIPLKYFKKDLNLEIDLNEDKEKIQRKIRALTFEGYPSPYITIEGIKYLIIPESWVEKRKNKHQNRSVEKV